MTTHAAAPRRNPTPSWYRSFSSLLTRVTLEPLDHATTVALARAVDPALDTQVAAAVADRSGGSPLDEARCIRCGLEFVRAATESLACVGAVAEAERWFEEAEHAPPRGDLQS